MRTTGRRILLQRPVRTVDVVMVGVLADDQPQVPLAGDQHPVQALAAGTAHPSVPRSRSHAAPGPVGLGNTIWVHCGRSGGDVVLVGEPEEDLLPADPVLCEVDRFRPAVSA